MSGENRKTVRHMLKQYSEAFLDNRGDEKKSRSSRKEKKEPRTHRRGGKLNNKPSAQCLSLNDIIYAEQQKKDGDDQSEDKLIPQGQGKNEYSHFSVFEDFSFIQCIKDFRNNPVGYTRQVYFQKLSERFQRTFCSIRRRWERIHTLFDYQKDLISRYYGEYPDNSHNRRIVFARDFCDASLVTCDSSFIPLAERLAFNALRKEIFGIDIAEEKEESEINSEDSLKAGEEAVFEDDDMKMYAINHLLKERVDLELEKKDNAIHDFSIESVKNKNNGYDLEIFPHNGAPNYHEANGINQEFSENESIASENSIFLDISGNDEEANRRNKMNGRARRLQKRSKLDSWNFQKPSSENNSQYSDLMPVSHENEVLSSQIGKHQLRDRSTDYPSVIGSRKKHKGDAGQQSPLSCLKEKLEVFKQSLVDDSVFKEEKTELLKSLLSYFCNNYDSSVETVGSLIRRDVPLNMEDLKFRLCMKFLSNRLNNVN